MLGFHATGGRSSWRRRCAVCAVLTLVATGCAEGPFPAEPQVGASGAATVVSASSVRHHPGDPVARYDAEIPIAYYDLSLDFTKTTAGFTPPVQSRAYGYMGLALYEALVGGMPRHRSIARQLNGVGELPSAGHSAKEEFSARHMTHERCQLVTEGAIACRAGNEAGTLTLPQHQRRIHQRLEAVSARSVFRIDAAHASSSPISR